MPPIDYSKWDNLSYSSSDEDEEKEKEELNKKIMQTNFENIAIGEPSKLWKLVIDWPDVFEKHVLLSGYLNGTDIKMFYGSCRASRRAVKRAKIELEDMFYISELSSISTMELAWEGYPWGTRRRLPNAGWKLRCCYVAPRIFLRSSRRNERSQITKMG